VGETEHPKLLSNKPTSLTPQRLQFTREGNVGKNSMCTYTDIFVLFKIILCNSSDISSDLHLDTSKGSSFSGNRRWRALFVSLGVGLRGAMHCDEGLPVFVLTP